MVILYTVPHKLNPFVISNHYQIRPKPLCKFAILTLTDNYFRSPDMCVNLKGKKFSSSYTQPLALQETRFAPALDVDIGLSLRNINLVTAYPKSS